MRIKAVILDVDQTLTIDTPSWIQFTNILGADPSIHTKIYEDFKAGKLDYQTAKQNLISLWQTKSTLTRLEIVNFFSKIKFRKNAFEAVNYLKTKYLVCLISGAIDVFIDDVADRLEIRDRFASTKFIFDSNDVLTDFDYKLTRGEDKLKFLDKFCKENSIDPKECAAIGDGESDIPIFMEVGLPMLFMAEETTEESKSMIPIHINDWSEISKYL